MPDRFIFTRKQPEEKGQYRIIQGDALTEVRRLPKASVDCIITSPPYKNKFVYGNSDQEHGQEKTLAEFLDYQRKLAKALLCVTKRHGNLFIVIGDSRCGSGGPGGDFKKSGQYCASRGAREDGVPRTAQLLVPERLRIVYAEAGWLPVQCIIWNKNDARRGATLRLSDSYEKILVFAKDPEHYWDRCSVLVPYSDKSLKQLTVPYTGQSATDYKALALEDPSDTKRRMIKNMRKRKGALLRDVWNIPSGSQPKVRLKNRKTGKIEEVPGVACFPLIIPELCINLGCPPDGVVLDCFSGMGTTILAASKWGRDSIGIELYSKWIKASQKRLRLP